MSRHENFTAAIKRLNESAYAALRAAKQLEEYPRINSQILLGVARLSDDIVEAGLQEVALR